MHLCHERRSFVWPNNRVPRRFTRPCGYTHDTRGTRTTIVYDHGHGSMRRVWWCDGGARIASRSKDLVRVRMPYSWEHDALKRFARARMLVVQADHFDVRSQQIFPKPTEKKRDWIFYKLYSLFFMYFFSSTTSTLVRTRI